MEQNYDYLFNPTMIKQNGRPEKFKGLITQNLKLNISRIFAAGNKLCKCGCGKFVKNDRFDYLDNHHTTIKSRIKWALEHMFLPCCLCGCGDQVKGPDQKYIMNHCKRNAKLSYSAKEHMRISAMNRKILPKFKNNKLETKLQNALSNKNHKFGTHDNLPGHPDIIFENEKTIIFVDGCWYHSCPYCYDGKYCKKSKYVDANRNRDNKNNLLLCVNGYKVLRVWEHEINEDINKVVNDIEIMLLK